MAKMNPKHIRARKDGKAPLEYLTTSADDGDALVLKGGADKYGIRNWTIDKILARTYIAAIRRHLKEWAEGVDVDKDSGQSPLNHIRACCAIVIDAEKHGTLIDDREFAESLSEADEAAADTHARPLDVRPPRMPRAPRTPQEVHGKMTMADYHDLADALEQQSDCIIRVPRDAGIGREYIVQYSYINTVISDGPFESFGAAEAYARENPNGRLGLVSICSLNPQEE